MKFGRNIVTDGLVLYLDAANPKSYVSGSTTCNDIYGSTNFDGTLTNGTSYSTDKQGVFVFDGVNDYIAMDMSTWLTDISNVSYPITVEFLVKFDNLTNDERLFTSVTEILYHRVMSVGINSNTFRTWDAGLGTWKVTTTTSMSTGVWYHHTIVIDSAGTNIKGYHNGVQESNQSFSPYAAITFSSMGIGNKYITYGQFFAGKLALFRIYSRALSASEVLQNYNALKDRFI